MLFSKEMYDYLAWLTLKEVFGNSIEWSEKENKKINLCLESAKNKLTPKEIKIVEARVRKMKNSYKADLLYSLEKMYWHELHDDRGSIYPPVEFEEETYNI